MCQTISNRPIHLNASDSPWSDVSTRALNEVEVILSICFELWIDK